MIKEALEYFNLRLDFTEEELNKAYQNQINILPVNFKEKKIDSEMLEKIQNYYMILYKCAKVKYIEKTYLKDVILSDIDKNQKNIVLNLPNNIENFYKANFLYNLEVGSLLSSIKLDFYTFYTFELDDCNSKEEVDKCLNKFIESIGNNYNKFLDGVLKAFADSKACDVRQLKIDFNIRNNSSVKEVMIDVYNILDKIKIVDKKNMRGEFSKLVDNTLEHGSEEYATAVKYYTLMFKERDDNEFLKIYDEATKYLDKAILKEYYKQVQNNITSGTEEYIVAMEYYGFLSVQDNHQKFISLYNEAKKYIESVNIENKPTKK